MSFIFYIDGNYFRTKKLEGISFNNMEINNVYLIPNEVLDYTDLQLENDYKFYEATEIEKYKKYTIVIGPVIREAINDDTKVTLKLNTNEFSFYWD
ncbi:hypothetical protein BpOF4_20914 (plasmid) [Alkalihalophilus pseudofirmus OF4]|uniref:Uncharacterized protein n=1 Tax=Alkalihalophilus pseudofirmus (strain ATCC BAA-2126 / JCM 17055 / OF4) TaxID=398511 RepID=D3G1F2_ALKPO|nr:hypothetical protein [Alkalihalophilus pseudofirmus]ADC52178.1 hypothetical protein BpOF4_20914 [Alkalihalophilus pseudofirmus OF4]